MIEDKNDGQRRPWDRQDGEPARWYARFLVYMELGPARTLAEAYANTLEKAGKGRKSTRPDGKLRPSGGWNTASRKYRWRERTLAWDAEQRDLLALSERNLRMARREQRVAITDEYLELARAVLSNMHLLAANEHQARKWLPEIRGLLRDMLAAQRLEYDKLEYMRGEKEEGVELQITADDLRAAQRALEERALEERALEERAIARGPQLPQLLVCIGPDARQQLDLAALRAVRTATGLPFCRLIDTTQRKFAESLRRERGLGHPIELLHLALPMGPQGVHFTDGWVDGAWLSERLQGVQVLLLIAGEGSANDALGDELGDWLGVVPHVICVSEEIGAEDAAVLTQHFWQGIGSGLEPGAALDAALQYCPPAVGELVVRHW